MAVPDSASPPAADAQRGAWKSKLGFILAASGSAIGLGNIVFFASNAYQYGGGAFYLPYFIALFVLGIPVMIVEFSMGTLTGRSFPLALQRLAGKKGEFVGWWSLASALTITMYYITILGWALSMLVGAFGSLLEPGASAPFAPFAEPSATVNATAWFFGMIATYWPMLAVATIWTLTILLLWRGTETIEKGVRVFVPLMWVFMIILILRGLTLPGGVDGVLYLFTPNMDGIADVRVWQGAFAQMFFSLSLGLGTMTAYASYLPKDADNVNNSLLVSFLNCGFEYIAGVAIFAMLFVYALNPAGTTLSLSFFVIPQGIAGFPFWVKGFGVFFFLLLVVAGLTSAVSLVEGMASALIDKLGISRVKGLTLVLVPGIAGSLMFALPTVIDPGLSGNGVLGLTLLDLVDNWAFRYSLLTVGLLECLLVGWVLGADKLRAAVNAHTKFKLPALFDWLIKLVIPAILALVLFGTLWQDLTREGGLYGSTYDMPGYGWLPAFIPVAWLVFTLVVAAVLASRPTAGSVLQTPLSS
ncbi:MAG: sodium-dependent transporter [Bacteroidota bacterium]